MGPVDVIVILAVALCLAVALRHLARSRKGGCSGCGSSSSCSSRGGSGACSAASDMIRHADAALSAHDRK